MKTEKANKPKSMNLKQEFLGKVSVKIHYRIIDIPKMECNKTETKTNQKQCKTFLIF